MKAFDEAFTNEIEQYAKEFFRVIEKYPKPELPMLLVAMSETVRAYLNSPYAMPKGMKELYKSMEKYLREHFDANVIHFIYESEESNNATNVDSMQSGDAAEQ